jgi:altronate dehydratase large subunit
MLAGKKFCCKPKGNPGGHWAFIATIEEKFIGAYCEYGDSPRSGLMKPCGVPRKVDCIFCMSSWTASHAPLRVSPHHDNAEHLIACGFPVVLSPTGRSAVGGSEIATLIKIAPIPKPPNV